MKILFNLMHTCILNVFLIKKKFLSLDEWTIYTKGWGQGYVWTHKWLQTKSWRLCKATKLRISIYCKCTVPVTRVLVNDATKLKLHVSFMGQSLFQNMHSFKMASFS